MIRETKNANSHTPIIAITAYLKELCAMDSTGPHPGSVPSGQTNNS
jgi:hypothetical protein